MNAQSYRFFIKRFGYSIVLLMLFFIFQNGWAATAPANKKNPSVISLTNVHFSEENKTTNVQLQFSSQIHRNQVYSFITEHPSRLIVDLVGVQNQWDHTQQKISQGLIRDVDVVQAQGRTRLIVNLLKMAKENIKLNDNTVTLALNSQSVLDQSSDEHFSAIGSKEAPAAHQVKDVNFALGPDGAGRIMVKVSDPSIGINIRQQGDSLLVDFENTTFTKDVKTLVPVPNQETPIKAIKTEQQDKNAVINARVSGKVSHLAYQVNDQFIINVKSEEQAAPVATTSQPASTSRDTISLNFQNIKVRSVLQLLAEFTGRNIVVSDGVTGDITLRLNNVRWQEALDIIMRTQGLAERQYGDILLIAPAKEIAEYEKQELQAKKEKQSLEPLISELVQLQFAKASDIEKLLKDKDNTLLSDRGHVSVDVRTNTLWIQDTPAKLKEIKALVRRLDVPVQQVLIESRIVNVDESLESELGIRFGITAPDHVSGTLTGANDIALLNPGDNPATVNPIDRLNFNLPAATLASTQPVSAAIALAKLGRGILLDLELSALENEQGIEIVSSPRVITANQQEAEINVGEQIPYEQATSSGATSIAFKTAALTLRVTPQITPDGRVILTLQVNQDKRGTDTPAGPAIDTREVKTQVLVDNGQTIVLGGLYEENKQNIVQRVPFIGKVPVIGNFFRHTTKKDLRTELLIFITPKILVENNAVTGKNSVPLDIR